MPKCKGHLYNWYETDSLEAVPPLFISTVDNGNLALQFVDFEAGLPGDDPTAIVALPRCGRGFATMPSSWPKSSSKIAMVAISFPRFSILEQAAEEIASANYDSDGRVADLREIDVLIFLNRHRSATRITEIVWWAKELSLRAANLLRTMETCRALAGSSI